MLSWVYTYGKTYQILYFKYIQFIMCQLYLNKVIRRRRRWRRRKKKRRFMFSDSHLLLTCCPSKSLTKAPKHENFSQIWKFLLETQDYIGSLDNLHKFKESLKIDAWKAFVTWSSYTILCSFWWENHSILPSIFSSLSNFPSHFAACIARVASPLHNSCHYKHSQLHSKMQPFKFLALKFWLCLPFLDSSYPPGCWMHFIFYALFFVLWPKISGHPHRSLALAL